MFPKGDCELLGLDLLKDDFMEIGGVIGHILNVYIHPVNLRIGGRIFTVDV